MALAGLARLRPALQQLRCSAAACRWDTRMLLPHPGPPHTPVIRPLATKSNKGKSKGHSAARVNINPSLVEDIIDLTDLQQNMRGVVDGLKEEFNKSLSIRTSPSSFDHIIVSTKDGKFPLSQLGQISVKSPRLLLINMSSFPECAPAVVNALRQSQMNLSPELDGSLIHVPVPQVTREHRENLVKLAKQLKNKSKDSLRKIRNQAVQEVMNADPTVPKDTKQLIEKQIQQMMDDTAVELEKQLSSKTKELLE